MSITIGILNNIRNNSSEEFQNRIPEATQDNLGQWSSGFANYENLWNEFHDQLMNKIGMTIIHDKLFKNKLARFKQGLVSPHDIEEIFVGMAQSEGAYDPEGPNPLGRREGPAVEVNYHRQNRQDKYVVSIGDIDFTRVFTNVKAVENFIKEKINALYSGDAYDEWLAMRQILTTSAVNAATYECQDFNDPAKGGYQPYDASKVFIKALRKAVQDVTYASTDYNEAGVLTWTESPSDLVLFIHKDVLVEVDVEIIANAFHDSATDTKVVPTIIPMDTLNSSSGGQTVYAVLADKEWLKMYDTLFRMESQRNADGLFTNYFLHHHQILSTSPFKNVVKFVGAYAD